MEISNDTKSRIFAQYLGQKVRVGIKSLAELTLMIDTSECISLDTLIHTNIVGHKLILKPISNITDEDAIEVAKILLSNKLNDYLWNPIVGKELVGIIASRRFYSFYYKNATNWVDAYQYLQLKGYDLTHYLLNGKTLQECGLAIYEK